MNLAKHNNIVAFFFATLSFFYAGAVYAQTENFAFSVSPQNPEPNSLVYVSISSFSVNLNNLPITWKIDGELVLSGTGETKTSFQTKDAGVPMLVEVAVRLSPAKTIEKTLIIQTSHVDLLWEALNSYTPPFYKGKALPAPESTIKVTAAPEIKNYTGKLYAPKNLTYQWKKGGDVQSFASGYNKQSFTFNHNVFDGEENVSVDVASPDGLSKGSSYVTIPLVRSRVAFYQEKPQEGINFSREVSKNRLTGQGRVTLVAIPYFFSTKTAGGQNVSYEWSLNDKKVATPSQKNKLSIEKEADGEGGLVSVGIVTENFSKLFQKDTGLFNLELQ